MATRTLPFDGMNDARIIGTLFNGGHPDWPTENPESPEAISSLIRSICEHCWTKVPADRPSVHAMREQLRFVAVSFQALCRICC